MKILLVSPPTESAIKKVIGTTGPPLGLAYLASMVRNEHDVKIVDSLVKNLDWKDAERIIRNYDPDMVGITATTSMIPDAYKIARISKKINSNVKVVMGGPHVTFTPNKTLTECSSVDFAVRGEGEYTFKELVDSIENKSELKKINGLSYKNGGNVVNNPPRELIRNVDEIPLPSYDLLPMREYKFDKLNFGTIVTSRGCPFNCVFCSSSLQFGKRWRGHSIGRVMEELSILRNEYKIREIEFLDDTFTLVKPRAIGISNEIKKEKLDISWTASSRVDTFSEEIAEAMKRGGAHTVYFGLESGSQKTLDFIGKGITPRQSIVSVRNAVRHGLRALGSFIIGFPNETKEDVNATIKFSDKVGVDLAQFTVATPYPGTRLWNYALANKLITTMNWRKFTTLTPVMKLKNFTSKQISNALRSAYLKFYLNPKRIIKDIIDDKGFLVRWMFSHFVKDHFFKDILEAI
ncbi:MAG: cobalamin-dependent protein [Candidatus Aenigmarchaeota archaeon]|nr:cobalamin-dependent protein [Candidatus Aenigmarchaeota archaeon]